MIKDKEGKEYQVVVVTPAGRERYLDIFKKYIYREMDNGLVDGWQLWQNTIDPAAIAYLESMVAENPKVKIYKLDEPITPATETIYEDLKKYNALQTHKFFKFCHDDNTIYIRFDDDIVWIEKGAIDKIVKARIEHPEAFLIYPNIINSTVITNWHQKKGVLGTEAGVLRDPKDSQDPDYIYLEEFNYTNSGLIDLIHETFKKNWNEDKLSDYYLPSRMMDDYQRFSICSICWWGKDHITPSELEESQMAWELPKLNNRPSYFLGDALMVHYSYHTQRTYLDACNPSKLDFYRDIANDFWYGRKKGWQDCAHEWVKTNDPHPLANGEVECTRCGLKDRHI